MANYINLQKALTEFAEELNSIITVKTLPEIDPLWNKWYDAAYIYEPEAKYDIPMDTVGGKLTKNDIQELSEAVSQMVEDVPLVRKDRSTRANRRRQKFYHKMKLQCNAEAIQGNYRKRFREDCENWSFSKKRGGRKVDNPKSLSMKSDAILKRAEKMMLIKSEDAQEDTVSQDNNQNKVVFKKEQKSVA